MLLWDLPGRGEATAQVDEGELFMKRIVLLIITCLLMAGSAFGYDAEKARSFEQFYQPF